MAYEQVADRLLAEMFDKDTNKRLQVGIALHGFLSEEENSVHDFDDLDRLIAGLVTWINSSHPKICTNGMEVLNMVCVVLGEKFKSHLSTVLPALRERLGDARQPVRDASLDCLLVIMEAIGSPQTVLDKLLPDTLGHKGWHVREQGLALVSKALDKFGSKNLLVGRYIAGICKLTGDANYQVRDQAVVALVDVYRHVGERIRGDLAKRGLPQARLDAVYEKFDEAQRAGSVVASSNHSTTETSTAGAAVAVAAAPPPAAAAAAAITTSSMSRSSSASFDTSADTSTSVFSSSSSRPGSRPQSRQNSSSNLRGMTPQRSGSSLSGAAESGAVDEDDFERSFDDCATILSSSARDIDDELTKVEETLTNVNLEWDVRVTVMKRMKGLLNNGAADLDVFHSHIATLRIPFATALKDLRSSVVREACITVALLATKYGPRLENFCEWVLPPLFQLVQNSAKIMASSGHVCIGFIIRHVHSHRLIPLFASQNINKAVSVRRRIAEYLEQILLQWSTQSLERQVSHLEEALKKGMNDADSGTRTFSRQAYWAFAKHFPAQAEKVKASLEPARQRLLTSEQSGGSKGTSTPSRLPPRSVSRSRLAPAGSASNLSGLKRRFTSEPDLSPSTQRSTRMEPSLASRSRTQDASSSSSSGVLRRPATTATASVSTANSIVSPATSLHGARHTGALGGPPMRLTRPASATPGRAKPVTRLPPTSKTPGRLEGRHFSDSTTPVTSVTSPLDLDDQDENMRADDLLSGSGGFDSESLPLCPRGYRDPDMDDDNMSIASDISTSSTASNFSIQSMSGRLHIVEDVPDILRLCQSGTWSDRRDGLASLGQLLQGSRSLFKNEVQRFLEVFYKLFSDPHNTVLGIFLDVLMDFILQYRADMRVWLPQLFQRLFTKLGADLRSAISRRMHHLEEVIRDSFEAGYQLSCLCKILNDQSQPQHLKVKLALLKYMSDLVVTMEASELVNNGEVRQGVTKIAGMANEPRNVELRRTASRVLHALSSLNEEVFMKMIAALPRNLKDSTLKAAEDAGREPKTPTKTRTPHRTSRTANQLSPQSATSSPVKRPSSSAAGSVGSSNLRSMSGISSSTPDLNRTAGARKYGVTSGPSPRITPPGGASRVAKRQITTARTSNTTPVSGSRTVPRKSTIAAAEARQQQQAKARSSSTSDQSPTKQQQQEHEHEPEQAQQEYQQQTPQSVKPLAAAAQLGMDNDVEANLTPHASEQPVFSMFGGDAATPVSSNGLTLPDEATPSNDANSSNVADQACLSLCVDDDDPSSIPALLDALANPSQVVACMQALESLGELAIEDDVELWDVHFDTVLDTDHLLFECDLVDIRVAALRFFRQLICFQPTRFNEDCAHTCIAKLLKCYVDASPDVVRQVEDMIPAVATALPAQAIVKSVLPIISRQEFPQVICCLKLLTKVVARVPPAELIDMLPSLIPPLITNYAHADSSVRKASVFCLVAMHAVVGESLMAHLKSLTVSQMRLLTMYIDRAKPSH
eukprot:scpid23818/ scgid31407/ CLIP-associating protein 2; Cytoplasmic linker-associated protein 2